MKSTNFKKNEHFTKIERHSLASFVMNKTTGFFWNSWCCYGIKRGNDLFKTFIWR